MNKLEIKLFQLDGVLKMTLEMTLDQSSILKLIKTSFCCAQILNKIKDLHYKMMAIL